MGTSPFLVGDTSSNGCFSIVMLVFRGVIYTPDVLFYSKRDLQPTMGLDKDTTILKLFRRDAVKREGCNYLDVPLEVRKWLVNVESKSGSIVEEANSIKSGQTTSSRLSQTLSPKIVLQSHEN